MLIIISGCCFHQHIRIEAYTIQWIIAGSDIFTDGLKCNGIDQLKGLLSISRFKIAVFVKYIVSRQQWLQLHLFIVQEHAALEKVFSFRLQVALRTANDHTNGIGLFFNDINGFVTFIYKIGKFYKESVEGNRRCSILKIQRGSALRVGTYWMHRWSYGYYLQNDQYDNSCWAKAIFI